MIKLGNKVMVSDPCYDNNPQSWAVIENVKEGDWNTTVTYDNETGRIAELIIRHNDFLNKFCVYDWDTTERYEIDVDSGQAGFYDYNYFIEHISEREYEDEYGFYGRCCALTAKHKWGEIQDNGVVSDSGYGDGCYDVQVRRFNEEAVAMRIIYIGEENEE